MRLAHGYPETAYGAPDNKFRVYMVFLTGEIISPTTIRLWHCSLKLIASDLAHTPVKKKRVAPAFPLINGFHSIVLDAYPEHVKV